MLVVVLPLAAALIAQADTKPHPPPLVFYVNAYTQRGSLGLKVKPNSKNGEVEVTGFTDLQAS